MPKQIKRRLFTKQKWAKGHSCDSNPEYNKHRQQAKSGLFVTQNASVRNKSEPAVDNMSVDSDDSCVSKFTAITQCTNMSILKVSNEMRNDFEFRESVISVITAISKVIKDKGGNENAVEYFAALCVLLSETTDKNSIASVTFLLAKVMPQVPSTLLVSRFSDVSKIFYTLLRKYSGTEEELLLRHTLICLAILLKVQPNSVWQYTSTADMLNTILSYSINCKHRLRRYASVAVLHVILGKNENSSNVHPAVNLCAKFCMHHLECKSNGEQRIVEYIFCLLKRVLPYMGDYYIRKQSELVLTHMADDEGSLCSLGFDLLKCMFSTKPSICTKLNAQLILALGDFRPNFLKADLFIVWLDTIVEAILCLEERDDKLASNFAEKLIVDAMPWLSSSSQRIVEKSAKVVRLLLNNCFVEKKNYAKSLFSLFSRFFHDLIEAQCTTAVAFELCGCFFENFGNYVSQLDELKMFTNNLTEMYNNHELLKQSTMIENLFSIMIKHVGVEDVMTHVRLKFDQAVAPGVPVDLSQVWMLKVLSFSVRRARIQYFLEYYFPMAIRLKLFACSRLAEQQRDESNAKLYEFLQKQIWNLFPSFCRNAVDLPACLDKLCDVIGTSLTERPDLRLTVLKAIRNLLHTEANNRLELEKFCDRISPLLCKLYCSSSLTDDDSSVVAVKLALAATVKRCFTFASDDLKSKLASFGLKRIGDDLQNEHPNVEKPMDMLVMLASHLNAAALEAVWEFLWANDCKLNEKCTLKKKVYQLLEAVLKNTTTTNMKIEPAMVIIDNLPKEKLTLSVKARRYHCILAIIDHLQSSEVIDLKKWLVQAFDDVHGGNAKLKRCVANLLFAVVEFLEKIRGTRDLALEEVMDILLDRLNLQSNSASNICSLVYGFRFLLFKYQLPAVLLDKMMQVMDELIRNDQRPVVASCLQFYLGFLKTQPSYVCDQYFRTIVEALFKQNCVCARHFRFKTREVLEELIRQYSFEEVAKFAPQEARKRLVAVRKLLAVRMRRKLGLKQQNRSKTQITAGRRSLKSAITTKPDTVRMLLFDPNPNSNNMNQRRKVMKKAASTVSVNLKEAADDEIADLLDLNLDKHLILKDKKMNKKLFEEDDFAIAEDGRIIIDDDEKMLQDEAEHQEYEFDKEEEEEDEDDDDDVGESGHSKVVDHHIKRQVAKKKNSKVEKHKRKDIGIHKRTSNLEPYAYIPLDKRLLRRRQQRKSKSIFKGIVGKRQK
ncbi:RRP12-like protein [Trichinella nativa]|uniref:RRP12-like protein n=1 Tax=Trichinella nativa TaxID=6335 RepID=A0A0V1LAJ9_9BILA|nr:RRP12-like protein [Trichinella nativa]